MTDRGPSSSASSSPRSMSASSPAALLEKVQEAKRNLSQSSLTATEAKSMLGDAADQPTKEVSSALPLAGVPAAKFLIHNSQSDPETKTNLTQQLDSALRQTTLCFAPKSAQKSVDPAYEKRLERLRLHDEERSYMNLTTNLKNKSSLKLGIVLEVCSSRSHT